MIYIPPDIAGEHLRTSFSKGDVFFWDSFPGKERERDSYFVLLSNCIGDQFLSVRATGRTDLYLGTDARRMHHDIVLITQNEAAIFPRDTILDLNWIMVVELDKLSQLLGSHIKKMGTFNEVILKRIDEAVEKATTVSERHKHLILGK